MLQIDPQILALPVGHLQLPNRAWWATKKCQTIGDLVALATSEASHTRSHVFLPEVIPVLRKLATLSAPGNVDFWDNFRRQRPKASNPVSIYFMSPVLQRLSPSVRGLSIDALHPSNRAVTALHLAGLRTIGKLVEAARNGLANFQHAGALTCTEIIDALEALSKSSRREGEVNWETYATTLGFPLLPRRPASGFIPRQFLRQCPRVVRAAVELQFGKKGVVLLQKRVLRSGTDVPSLRKIGRELKISHERARLLERDILQMLRRAIMNGEYRSCEFRFRSEFVKPIQQLGEAIQRSGNRAFSQSEWQRLLATCWTVTPAELGSLERLILSILQFRLISFRDRRFNSLIVSRERRPTVYRKAMAQTEHLLTRQFAMGRSTTDLLKDLRSKVDQIQLQRSDVQAVVQSVRGVRRCEGNESYKSDISRLKTLANQLERLLRESGTAMHFRDLTSKLNQLTGIQHKPHDIAVAMSDDPRFRDIARRGTWILADWRHVETRPIADIAAELMNERNRSFTEQALFKFLSMRRSVKQSSIGTVLRADCRFEKIAPLTWQLKRLRHGMSH